jgi:serine/threonine-protein kinase
MGAIYRAFDINLSTPVAIKENFLQTPQAINQFKREAFILARLRHPGLPRVIDHFSFEERQYLVMDFIEGHDVWQIIQQQQRPLDEVPALEYIIQVCEAVDYLHQQKPPIIHRDIKPQNIKVTPDDKAVLVDFGIAKQGSIDSATQSGARGVTPGFSSPEQYSGSGTTPASDIFSLGATLYALLTGKKPPNSISLLTDSSKFQPPDKVNVRLTHRTSQAIMHAMQVKPDNRPPAVTVWQKELAACLEEARQTVASLPQPKEEETLAAVVLPAARPVPPAARPAPPPVPALVAVPPATPPPRSSSRWPVVLLGLVIVLLAGLGAGVYALYTMGLLGPTVAQVDTPTVTVETPLPMVDTSVTRQAETELTTQPNIEETRQANQNTTATPEAERVEPTNTNTATSTATPPSVAGDTLKTTPLPATAIATPAAIVTPASTPAQVSAGPTLVPLQSGETIDRIGSREVVDVDLNLKNPLEVYALVKGDGIYKSINGGDGPWTKLNVDGSSITAFVIDPQNPATFYAPTWNAVLKSDDGGNTWQAYGNGLSSANRVVDVVTVDPANPSRVYASIGTTLVVSTDGGQTWTSDGVGAGLLGGRITTIVVDQFNPDIVYVAGLFASIYKSNDGGRNFAPLVYPGGGMGEGVYSMAGHPSEQNVYLAGINAFQAGVVKTENGADLFNSTIGLIYGGADSAYSGLAYAPSNGNIVYVGSGYEDNRFAKGIFQSTDGGETWSRASNGLSINRDIGQPYYVKVITVHPTKPRMAFAATGGGLFKTVDGLNWTLQ